MDDVEGKVDLAPPKRELTGEQLKERELLGLVGSLMYGERGQTALARRLSQFADRPVSQVLINHWLAGRYAIPTWGIEALARVSEDAPGGLRMRAGLFETNITPALRASLVARGVIQTLERTGPLAEAPPDDLAPLGGPDDYRPDDDDPAP